MSGLSERVGTDIATGNWERLPESHQESSNLTRKIGRDPIYRGPRCDHRWCLNRATQFVPNGDKVWHYCHPHSLLDINQHTRKGVKEGKEAATSA